MWKNKCSHCAGIKSISGNEPRNGTSLFLIHRPNIKDQIVSWITEEIRYLEKRKKILTKDHHYLIENDIPGKLKLDLSVDQFCYLIKAGLETGLIMAEDVKALSILLSKYVSTKRKENISANSIRNKIYQFQVEDPESLRDTIKNWLNYCL